MLNNLIIILISGILFIGFINNFEDNNIIKGIIYGLALLGFAFLMK